MLTRFFNIKDHQGQLLLPEIYTPFTEDAQRKDLGTPMKLLTDLEAVTKTLQNEKVNPFESRGLFDEVIGLYSSLDCRRMALIPIVENKCVMTAVKNSDKKTSATSRVQSAPASEASQLLTPWKRSWHRSTKKQQQWLRRCWWNDENAQPRNHEADWVFGCSFFCWGHPLYATDFFLRRASTMWS